MTNVIPPKQQLRMHFPERLLAVLPPPVCPPGMRLRCLRDGDEAAYLELMRRAGFIWSSDDFRCNVQAALPQGILVLEEERSGFLAATAMACERPPDGCAPGGELGWVAADPGYRGKGLGGVICHAVLWHFKQAGYRSIYLRTDDFRKAAVKTYLKQGWEPLLFLPDMAERWEALQLELLVGTGAEK